MSTTRSGSGVQACRNVSVPPDCSVGPTSPPSLLIPLKAKTSITVLACFVGVLGLAKDSEAMTKLLTAFVAIIVSTVATDALSVEDDDVWIAGVIKSFECGDNCWLTIAKDPLN